MKTKKTKLFDKLSSYNQKKVVKTLNKDLVDSLKDKILVIQLRVDEAIMLNDLFYPGKEFEYEKFIRLFQ